MNDQKRGIAARVRAAAVAAAVCLTAAGAQASSHMDAPRITFDDAANTTDVYAFVSERDGVKYLTTALAVYPFEEPGIGPNAYQFDDRVRYEIHVSTGKDLPAGKPSLSYQFDFSTEFVDDQTILQSYLDVVNQVEDENQNRRQSYTVSRVDRRGRKFGKPKLLGSGVGPPNNQGLLTRFYNQDDDGDMPAKEGVASGVALDPYTDLAIAELASGYEVFAGQRDDGFYADIQDIFDLDLLADASGFAFGTVTGTPTKPFDSQGGFNVHTIVLNIPLDELEGATAAGVYAITSRRMPVTGKGNNAGNHNPDSGRFIQVGRQGNPLFVEALVGLADKDLYNQTQPTEDEQFRVYAKDPVEGSDEGVEISRLLGVTPPVPGLLEFIFIPDLIKVDLTTGPARTPNDPDFNRLSGILEVLGGDVTGADVLINDEGQVVFGGWPNGRRFGDDVVDIALLAVGTAPAFVAAPDGPNFDGVTENDITYNDVFPYGATPLNGRNHGHHGAPGAGL